MWRVVLAVVAAIAVAGISMLAAVPQTLFTTQTPVVMGAADGAHELGMRFQSSMAGTINAIRYWKDAGEPAGGHTGHIWSATGTLLASTTFAGEAASGWQEQPLLAPLSILPDTTYVVSTNITTRYVATNSGPYWPVVNTDAGLFFPIVNGALTSIAADNNGVFGTPGLFPTQSYDFSNYFVDVEFTPGSNITPPQPKGCLQTLVSVDNGATFSAYPNVGSPAAFQGNIPVEFKLVVTNCGTVPLNPNTTDACINANPNTSPFACDLIGHGGLSGPGLLLYGDAVAAPNTSTLAPGASVTFTAAQLPNLKVSAADFANLCSTTFALTGAREVRADTEVDWYANGLPGLYNGDAYIECPGPQQQQPQLVLNKTPDAGVFNSGDPITFTMVLTNTGTGPASNVTLSDSLPTNGGLTWPNVSSPNAKLQTTQGSCIVTGGSVLSCSLGSIQAQGSVTVMVTSNASPAAACMVQPNTAFASGSNAATVSDIGSYSCTSTRSAPQLALLKTPKNGTFTAGQPITFTMVVSNPGDATATAVVLSDTLPTSGGLTWATALTSQGTCTLISAALNCNLGNIAPAPGTAVTVTVTSNSSPAGACQTQSNTAFASASNVAQASDTGSYTCGTALPPTACSIRYPFSSANPKTSLAFNENEVLKAFTHDGTGASESLRVWYSDEHAPALGIRQVSIKTKTGTTVTSYTVTPLPSIPGGATNPLVGTTALTGDQAGVDPFGRPIYPSLFITDITVDPTALTGDWQFGGLPTAPQAVFGTWKAGLILLDKTKSPALMTITLDADPKKMNNWSLGAGSDTPPTGLVNEGYGTEGRWNVSALRYNGQPLQAGHTYRAQVIVHDGDQNKTGGDVGQACLNFQPGVK